MRERRRKPVALFVVMLAGSPLPAAAFDVHLIGIYQGSGLTAMAQGLENGGYELSDGTWVSFDKWYHSDWVDLRFEMLTQFSDNFGIIWGASTGQQADKIRIDPSAKLGVIFQQQPTPSTVLSLTVSSTLFGNLSESPCIADYGAIGGIQSVNCRLAASPLPPADTLKYLVNAAPSRLSVSLSFRGRF
jgi:hypothetical protein